MLRLHSRIDPRVTEYQDLPFCHPDRSRSEAEWRDPDTLSPTMPIRGVLTRTGPPRRRAAHSIERGVLFSPANCFFFVPDHRFLSRSTASLSGTHFAIRPRERMRRRARAKWVPITYQTLLLLSFLHRLVGHLGYKAGISTVSPLPLRPGPALDLLRLLSRFLRLRLSLPRTTP
jgi:hypothetical protein